MLRRIAIENIELLLSGAGLAIILVVPQFIASDGFEYWQATAVTAIAVGLLHGIIFWFIRRRQRLIRQQSILQIREMLHDVMRNQLGIISFNAYLSQGDAQYIEQIETTISEMVSVLDHISDESFQSWREYYGERAVEMQIMSLKAAS